MHLRITSRWDAHEACDSDISHLISIQNPDADLTDLRPASIEADQHLVLLFEDLQDPDDPNSPTAPHVQQLVDWLRAIDPESVRGLVVHCDAGVSRSTAAAWVALLVLEPETPPAEHLARVAECSRTNYCWPSNLIAALADQVLDHEDSLEEILTSWKKELRDRKW